MFAFCSVQTKSPCVTSSKQIAACKKTPGISFGDSQDLGPCSSGCSCRTNDAKRKMNLIAIASNLLAKRMQACFSFRKFTSGSVESPPRHRLLAPGKIHRMHFTHRMGLDRNLWPLVPSLHGARPRSRICKSVHKLKNCN